jgi:hypothetical protein
MAPLNTIVTRYELSKIFSPTELTSWRSAAKDASHSIVSGMVLNLTSSLENFPVLAWPGQKFRSKVSSNPYQISQQRFYKGFWPNEPKS